MIKLNLPRIICLKIIGIELKYKYESRNDIWKVFSWGTGLTRPIEANLS